MILVFSALFTFFLSLMPLLSLVKMPTSPMSHLHRPRVTGHSGQPGSSLHNLHNQPACSTLPPTSIFGTRSQGCKLAGLDGTDTGRQQRRLLSDAKLLPFPKLLMVFTNQCHCNKISGAMHNFSLIVCEIIHLGSKSKQATHQSSRRLFYGRY